jgi:colanic acid/amylovoran biosynthesis glycosyltransferase
MKIVCHILRKSSQLRATFINNQISNHIRFTPFVIYRYNKNNLYDGGYSDFSKDLISLNLYEYENRISKLLYSGPKILSQSLIRKVQIFLAENNIQLIHFHFGSDCGVFYPLTKYLDCPSVVSFYGYDYSMFPGYMMGYGKKYLQNRVFKRVNTVLAMSPDMKSDLIKLGCPEEKIIVHYYGTDCKRFYIKRDYAERRIPTILTVSAIFPKKGHKFQFEGLKNLIKSGVTNFQMRVAGGGKTESELKKFVNDNGLKDHVVFLGPIKYGSKEMMSEYKNADIFLHPSVVAPDGDKEGIPGTIVEAMSAGLPIVATYHAGIPFIIEDKKTGLLVNEWDVDSLADAIGQLIHNRDMRENIGRAAQEYAVKHLELIEKEKALEKIYDELLEQNN